MTSLVFDEIYNVTIDSSPVLDYFFCATTSQIFDRGSMTMSRKPTGPFRETLNIYFFENQTTALKINLND